MKIKGILKKIPEFSLFFIVLAIVITTKIILNETVPMPSGNIGISGFKYRSHHNDALMGIIAGITACGLIAIFLINRFKPQLMTVKVKKIGKILIIALVVFSAFVYYYGSRGIAKQHYPKFWDSYHYFLGAKYFKELGYNKLYECHVKADSERKKPKYHDYEKVRDLTTYKFITVKQARKKADCSAFTPARWREFKKDLDFYDSFNLRRVVHDHGYNGTPFHAFIAGNLANIFPVNYSSIVAISFIDIIAICIMFALIAWAFGWKIACLMALFYFTNFADRFNYIGASYFRYIWMVALGAGIAFLKKEKYAPAAVFMTAAAMLNVFPLLFVAGIGLKALVRLVKERKLVPQYKTFILWGLIATIVFGSLSLMQKRHVGNYKEFLGNMTSHSKLLTRSRIGFLYNFIYYGEMTTRDRSFSYSFKAMELQKKKVGFNIIVLLILLFGFAVVYRLDDVNATVLGGFLLFFLLFSTVEYYYAVSGVLILFWHRDIDENRSLPYLALLFGLMGVVYLFWEHTRFLKFCNNYAMSWLFTVYLGTVLFVTGKQTGVNAVICSFADRHILSRLRSTRFADVMKTVLLSIKLFFLAKWKYILIGSGIAVAGIVSVIVLLNATKGPEYTLFASGDTILARRMHYYVYRRGPGWPLRDVSKIMKKADIAMTNLETVIATKGKMYPKGNKNPYYFRGRPVLTDILVNAGVDFVTTANNHAMDYGPEALFQQQLILEDAGIAFAGSGKDLAEARMPAFIKVKDIVIAFISMYVGGGDTIATEKKPGIFQVRTNREVLQALRPSYEYARKRAHLVVFSPHWGYNMTRNPTRTRRILARRIINMGFDAIIGHSAHQLHGVEVYRGKPIVYDMGNFVADWVSNKRMSRGAAFLLRFNKTGFTRLHILPLKLRPGRVLLAKGRELSRVQRLIVKLSRRINRRIDFDEEGTMLEVQLSPSRKPKQIIQPGKIHITNSTRPLPISYRLETGDYVRKTPPAYTAYFKPVFLESSVEVLGAKTVQTVKPGSCFLLEVAARIKKPLRGQWEAVVFVKNRKSDSRNDSYIYRHPLSNGVIAPQSLKPGTIIIDRVCVRSRKRVKQGDYDVLWALRNRQTRKWLYAGSEFSGKKPVKVGQVIISEKAKSRLASGIDWDGKR